MSNPPSNTLPELNRLHVAIQEVQEEIDRGPRLLKARHNVTLGKQEDLESQKLKLKQLRLAADQKSLQLKTNEAKIVDLKGKLNQAASNREFDIFKGQIEADKVANSVLEDEILEALEKIDGVQVDIKKLEAEVVAAQADENKFSAEVDRKRGGHRRLVQAHGAGALAAVENATCTSCYVRLTSQNAVSILSGTIMFCRTCGRLLFAKPEEA
ncbi:MAG: hypothetical protein NT069_33785 [Planctomycetota bacterium]|nr:hypothetical protein [Planctomycetota bacterium]